VNLGWLHLPAQIAVGLVLARLLEHLLTRLGLSLG
jgi:hypothetical protein